MRLVDRFVEAALVAEGPDIELEAQFEFDAVFFRECSRGSGAEIGLAVLGHRQVNSNLHVDGNRARCRVKKVSEGFAGLAWTCLDSSEWVDGIIRPPKRQAIRWRRAPAGFQCA